MNLSKPAERHYKPVLRAARRQGWTVRLTGHNHIALVSLCGVLEQMTCAPVGELGGVYP